MSMNYLLSRVIKDEDTSCWIWQGNMNDGGLPRMQNPNHSRRSVSVRRYAYEMTVGPIKRGDFAVGTCGDERCVNPEHTKVRARKAQMNKIRPLGLKVITLTGAKISAIKRAQSRFTDAQIAQMRREFPTLGVRGVAKKWGMSHSYASYIRNNRYRRERTSLAGMVAQMRYSA